MKLLIIGGTGFLGRHITELALEGGHEVTLFNRGLRNPLLFGGRVLWLEGDRKKNLSPLQYKKFDVVIDTCGYFPSDIKSLCEILKDNVQHYVFVSTISTYDMDRLQEPTITEDSPLYEGQVSPEGNYGLLKALSEQVVQSYFMDSSTIIRPGYIVGPHDHTFRLPYWIERVSFGGKVLLPGEADAPVQFVDVRDLADFVLQCACKQTQGIYNVAGPQVNLTFQGLLEECQEIVKREADFVPCEEGRLEREMEAHRTILPFWSRKMDWPQMRTNFDKARNAGLTLRDHRETLNDIWEWLKTQQDKTFPFGMMDLTIEKEIISRLNS